MRGSAWVLLAVVCCVGFDIRREPPQPGLSSEGRFLYANDDDWDWATPGQANEPCRLSVYGRMSWSALDWLEEGLAEVRGVLVGTPPASGNYLTMADLNKFRSAGSKRSYEQLTPKANVLRDLLTDKKPPNLIILMQDIGPPQPVYTAADAAAAVEFVHRGGRLIILDDWSYYTAFAEAFAAKKRLPQVQAPAIDPKLRQQVAELVEQLGSDRFTTREQASKNLLQMGSGIVSILRTLNPDNQETQRRVAAILDKLDPPPQVNVNNQADENWLRGLAQKAKAAYDNTELRTISRNGNQTPGLAWCVRLKVARE